MTDKTTERIINNKVNIVGKVVSCFEFSHEAYDEKFYQFYVSIKRKSGTCDIIPVLFSEKLYCTFENLIGEYVEITGEYRSYNNNKKNERQVVLLVFVDHMQLLTSDEDIRISEINEIFLTGHICKPPVYRKCLYNREITSLIIAVNRINIQKSDYIPIIFWGRNARYSKNFNIGDKVQIQGRIQSRKYMKKLDVNNFETRTTYEVSVGKLKYLSWI